MLGLPAPFPNVGNYITSVTNNGDTTYDITFDQPITWDGTEDAGPNILLFSPGDDRWNLCYPIATVGPATLTFEDGDNNTDCSKAVILGDLTHISTGEGWQAAGPIFGF